MVNRDLATSTEGADRLRALGRNHTLWSILVKDLALVENRMPDALKTELVGLGLWSMHYSTIAMLQNLSTQPLIQVNTNVVEGLLAQGGISQKSDGVLKAALSA